ncbi:MAG: glycosyltransferase family 2 protein [Azoarcus sp.]|jgi:glycosyltransferase involved in cell wall biosynthesis|nr:glycosyltransferase family 2 protein [Azoarcus sp.]
MKVSVVIPTFNRARLLGSAVDSALAQDGGGLEIEVIVVDDHSSDDTLRRLTARFGGDARVMVLRNARARGAAGARNTGILAARHPYVAFLDSDDRYLPGHLAAAAAVFEAHPRVGVVFGRSLYEEGGAEIPHIGPHFERSLSRAPRVAETDEVIVFTPDFFAHLLEAGCYVALTTVVLKAEAARELMEESLRVAEDYEFWTRLSRKYVFACLKAPQTRMLRHGENLSSDCAGSMAPMNIHAYELMLAYPGLRACEKRLLYRRFAQSYFDWAWWRRENGQFMESLRLNLKSIRYGLILRNLAAMAKLPLAAFKRSGSSGRAS